MQSKNINYANYMDNPELQQVCLKCEATDCDGICDDYRNAVRKMLGLRPLPVKSEKPVPELRDRKDYEYHVLTSASGESHTMREWCDILGISYCTLYGRIFQLGMTLDEAISYKKSMTLVCVDGEIHPISEWAKILGINRNTLYGRINRGYTPEEAVRMGRRIEGRKRRGF